jgi:DNA-directed RNA polymerase subunit M/transcription elongation factor TFIIS
MEDSQKKGVIVAGICLAVAIIVTFAFNNPFGGGGGAPTGPMLMKCSDCGHTFEISREKYREEIQKVMEDQGQIMMGPMSQRIGISCPNCGKQAAYEAKECPKCEHIFILDYTNPEDYPDRCPECGYSEYEEQSNN